jgi:hypothetical protein
MKKPALLLSLLALGALGLVACGGGDDDGVTAASKTKTTRDGPAADNKSETKTTRDELIANTKSCGSFGRYGFAVVEGDVSCRVARGVMRANSLDPPPPGGKDRGVEGQPRRFPGSWSCNGPDSEWVCLNEAQEMIVAWCCGTDQQEALRGQAHGLDPYIAAGLRE